MSTNRTGVVIFVNFSMPFFTPPSTTSAFASRKMLCAIIGFQVDEMKLANSALSAAPAAPATLAAAAPAAPVPNAWATALKRYSTDQPPTTL